MKMLRVATVPVENSNEILPGSGEQDSDHMSGFEGKFLDTLLAASGLKYKIVRPADGEWGRRKEDGNWTGIIGMVARGEVDVGFGLIRQMEERQGAVDFSRFYTIDGYTMVNERPGQLAPILAFAYPFDVRVWGAMSCSIILLTLLSKLLDRDPSCGGNLFKFATSLLLQSLEMGDGTLKWRFLLGSWHFFSLVMTAAYSAALLSFLTVPLSGTAVEDFNQLSVAVQKGTHRCYVLKGTSQLQALRDSPNEAKMILGEAIDRKHWHYGFPDIGKDTYIGQDSAIVSSSLSSYLFYGSRPGMFISKDTIDVSSVGVALGKTFCCKSKLDAVISRLSSAGLFDKLLRDEAFKFSLKYTFVEQSRMDLSIKDVSGCFAMLCMGWMVSVVVMATEIIVSRFCKRHERTKPHKKWLVHDSRGY